MIKNGIGLFLLPVYTVYLTPGDYGVVSVVTSLVSFFSLVVMLSMPGAGVRFHYDCADDEDRRKTLWGTIYTFVILFSVALTGGLVLGHRVLVDPFFGDVPFTPYLLLGLLTCLFQAGFNVFQAYLRAGQQGERYGAYDMAFFLVKVGLTLTLVVVFEMAALGVILALAATQLLFSLVSHLRLAPAVKLGVDRLMLRRTLAYGLPLLPHALAGFAMTLIDRIFLVNLKGTADVGIYTIGFQIAGVLQMVAIAVNQAYSPWFYQKCKEGASGEGKIRELSEFFVVAFALAGLMLVLFSREVLEIFVTADFEGGWVVTPFLVFAFVFRGLYFMTVGPVFLERVRLLPVITIGAALLNVALNALLIPPYGIIGASAASLVTMFAAAVATVAVSLGLGTVAFRWRTMFLVSLSCLALSMVVFLDGYLGWWPLLGVKAAVAIAAGLLFLYRYRERGMALVRLLKR